MSFTIKWNRIPDNVCSNFIDACGGGDPILDEWQYHINMENMFAEFKAHEFHDDETLKFAEFDKVIFESEAYYIWFLLRFA
jgi:hypothetical protein